MDPENSTLNNEMHQKIGGLGSPRFTVGLDDVKGFSQSK